jgi:uncharacterized protein YoxC
MISANGVEYKNLPEQVQYLTERAAEFAVELNRVSTSLEGVTTNVESLQANVEGLQTDVAALQTSYTTLAEDMRIAKININTLFTNFANVLVPLYELQDSYFNKVEVSTTSQIKWTKFLTFTKTTDTTFVFETAKDDCLNEYKARITNGGNADIVLTFTGVTNILCNDDNCVILNNTLTLPTGVTIEISVLGGNMVAINFEA